nr:hypothetical protein [Tanacetum cinerariifolium]
MFGFVRSLAGSFICCCGFDTCFEVFCYSRCLFSYSCDCVVSIFLWYTLALSVLWWFHHLVCGVSCYYGLIGFVVASHALLLILFGDMLVVLFHCSFVGLSGCQDGGGNRLTKTSLITHLRDRHCSGEAQVSFRTHTLRSKCRHGNGLDFVSPPVGGDGVVQFVLYDLVKPLVPSCSKQFDHEESIVNAIQLWWMPGGSLQLLRETLAESSPTFLDVDDDGLDLGERNINEATLEDLKTKHHFYHAPSLPHTPTDHHHLIASLTVVLDRIKSFPCGTSYGLDKLCAQHLMDCLSGAIAAIFDDAPRTPLVKQSGGIRPIDMGGSKAIFHFVNRLIEACGDDVGLSMLLVYFNNAFNLVDREGDPVSPLLFSLVLHPLICKIRDSFSLSLHAWYLDDGIIVGDIMVVGKVLELIMDDGSGCGLHLNVNKTKVFWPKEDPRSRIAGIFPPNIARPLHYVKLLGGFASVDFDFCNELVMKRVAKTIMVMDVTSKINDSQCELLFLRSCTGICRLYFTMRTCPPRVFESAQHSFDVALCSSLKRITKLLRHTGIVASGPIFDDALSVFSTSMETDLLSNPSKIAAPKLIKKMAYIYFARVTKNAEPTFSLSPRHVALWNSQKEDHTSDWLRAVPNSGLGQTMNAGKEVDIGLDGGCDKQLHATDMFLYSWDEGLDVCVNLTGSSPLTQTGMLKVYELIGTVSVHVNVVQCSDMVYISDFVLGRAVIDVAQRKRVKYMAKCAAIGYEFFSFSLSFLWELEADAITLMNRIRKFSMAQDIGACVVVHIFNRISFAIAKGVVDQITSMLPSNLL